MSSLLKKQIIKPLSKFAKNLDTNKLKINTLRGEIDLINLELDENALMEVMDLPTWLQLKNATCNKVSVKIQWTKLNNQPIHVALDRVHVQLEALENPRDIPNEVTSSYRSSTGKYGFADKVIDSIKITVNLVHIEFLAPTFKSSIEINRIVVASKLPDWRNGDLSHTTLLSPDKSSLLHFKEISWESTRIEANGLLKDHEIFPVKLITNTATIRMIFKKSMSDCSVLSSKIEFAFDDLMWILTVGQLEASSIFIHSLQQSINRSTEQAKKRAQEKAKKSENTRKQPPDNTSQPNQYQSANSSKNPQKILYDRYDISEVSWKFSVLRIDLHFCEDSIEGFSLSEFSVKNGSIQMHIDNFNYSHYPYHFANTSREKFENYYDLDGLRREWLTSLDDCNPNIRQYQTANSKASDSITMECISYLRIADLSISFVNYPGRKANSCPVTGKEIIKLNGTMDAENILSSTIYSGNFLGSDSALHKFPENNDLISIDFTEIYSSSSQDGDHSSERNQNVTVYVHIAPVYINLDGDTIIWMNAFLLNVHKAFNKIRSTLLLADEGSELKLEDVYLRIDCLMPRIIFPFPMQEKSLIKFYGPDAIAMHMDAVRIQSLPKGVFPQRYVSCLRSQMEGINVRHNDPSFVMNDNHFSFFQSISDSLNRERSQAIKNDFNLVCIHCTQFWIDFYTRAELTANPGTMNTTIRQPFLEPIPLLLWIALPIGNKQDYIPMLFDIDQMNCPLDTRTFTTAGTPNSTTPIRMMIGSAGPRRELLVTPTKSKYGRDRVPDFFDHLTVLSSFANWISELKEILFIELETFSSNQKDLVQELCEGVKSKIFLYNKINREFQLLFYLPESKHNMSDRISVQRQSSRSSLSTNSMQGNPVVANNVNSFNENRTLKNMKNSSSSSLSKTAEEFSINRNYISSPPSRPCATNLDSTSINENSLNASLDNLSLNETISVDEGLVFNNQNFPYDLYLSSNTDEISKNRLENHIQNSFSYGKLPKYENYNAPTIGFSICGLLINIGLVDEDVIHLEMNVGDVAFLNVQDGRQVDRDWLESALLRAKVEMKSFVDSNMQKTSEIIVNSLGTKQMKIDLPNMEVNRLTSHIAKRLVELHPNEMITFSDHLRRLSTPTMNVDFENVRERIGYSHSLLTIFADLTRSIEVNLVTDFESEQGMLKKIILDSGIQLNFKDGILKIDTARDTDVKEHAVNRHEFNSFNTQEQASKALVEKLADEKEKLSDDLASANARIALLSSEITLLRSQCNELQRQQKDPKKRAKSSFLDLGRRPTEDSHHQQNGSKFYVNQCQLLGKACRSLSQSPDCRKVQHQYQNDSKSFMHQQFGLRKRLTFQGPKRAYSQMFTQTSLYKESLPFPDNDRMFKNSPPPIPPFSRLRTSLSESNEKCNEIK